MADTFILQAVRHAAATNLQATAEPKAFGAVTTALPPSNVEIVPPPILATTSTAAPAPELA